jgi:predicted permease
MGSPASARELVRSASWDAPCRALGRDIRFGARLLRRSPGFAIVAILLLALGIGSTTALFSVADEVLFRPLPVRAPEQLVVFGWTIRPPWPGMSVPVGVSQDVKTGENRSSGFSHLTFESLQARWKTLTGIIAFTSAFPLYVGDATEMVSTGQLVSGNYFEVLGVGTIRGRALTPDDDQGALVAVISHRYWDRQFGRSDDILRKTVHVGDLELAIVGVTPAGFTGTQDVGSAPDITLPLRLASQLTRVGPKNIDRIHREPRIWGLRLMGRMADGASPDRVRAEIGPAFQASALASYAPGSRATHAPNLTISSGSQGVSENRRQLGQVVLILGVIVGVLLLIVCINLANLQYARAEVRQTELAVRMALGASRAAIVRQMLTESVVLSAVGGALGAWSAWWGKDLLLAWLTRLNPAYVFEPRLDARVVGVAVAATVVTGLAVAMAPALRVSGRDPHGRLKNAARTMAGSQIVRRVLLAGEIGLSVVLVVLATLFSRSLFNLATADLGIQADRLVWFNLRPAIPPGMKSAAKLGPTNSLAFGDILTRLEGIPGVQSVAYSDYPLVDGDRAMPYLYVPGVERRPDEDRTVYYESVSPNFFATVGMPVVGGRAFRDDDRSRMLAIVNETLAKRFFGGDAVGRRIGTTKDATVPPMADNSLIEIVGVVGDSKYMSLRESDLPAVFVSGMLPGAGAYAVRASIDPAALVPVIRPALAEFSRFTVRNVRTQMDQTSRTFERERHLATLSGVAGVLAVLLSGIGLYGLLSYSVVRRTQEIGVRVALGASVRTIVASVIRETLTVTACGLGCGVAAALAVANVARHELFGLTPQDPAVIAAAVAVTCAIAIVAALIPARRAASVDPVVALRSE